MYPFAAPQRRRGQQYGQGDRDQRVLGAATEPGCKGTGRAQPQLAYLISRHATAYTWLPASTQTFPDPPALARRLAAQGFTEVSYELFMGGVCAMHVGTRPAPSARRPV